MITVRGPTSRLGDDCFPEIEVTGTPRRALVLGANINGFRVSRSSSSSSPQYCAGRRLTLHIRTLEVRPES